MKLKSLRIELETYGQYKGLYVGTISYEGIAGEIKVALSPDVSGEFLKVAGISIKKFALDGMTALHTAIATEIENINQPKP